MNYMDLIKYKYILWINTDMAWQPNGFDNLDLLPAIIKSAYGSETVLTKRIDINIKEKN